MPFDSLFDEAMISADKAIEEEFASQFVFLLKDGSTLEVNAIFDMNQEMPKGSASNKRSFVAESGLLTVLNNRLDNELIHGASVETKMGKRFVANVEYPDETTMNIILSMKPKNSTTVNSSDNFL